MEEKDKINNQEEQIVETDPTTNQKLYTIQLDIYDIVKDKVIQELKSEGIYIPDEKVDEVKVKIDRMLKSEDDEIEEDNIDNEIESEGDGEEEKVKPVLPEEVSDHDLIDYEDVQSENEEEGIEPIQLDEQEFKKLINKIKKSIGKTNNSKINTKKILESKIEKVLKSKINLKRSDNQMKTKKVDKEKIKESIKKELIKMKIKKKIMEQKAKESKKSKPIKESKLSKNELKKKRIKEQLERSVRKRKIKEQLRKSFEKRKQLMKESRKRKISDRDMNRVKRLKRILESKRFKTRKPILSKRKRVLESMRTKRFVREQEDGLKRDVKIKDESFEFEIIQFSDGHWDLFKGKTWINGAEWKFDDESGKFFTILLLDPNSSRVIKALKSNDVPQSQIKEMMLYDPEGVQEEVQDKVYFSDIDRMIERIEREEGVKFGRVPYGDITQKLDGMYKEWVDEVEQWLRSIPDSELDGPNGYDVLLRELKKMYQEFHGKLLKEAEKLLRQHTIKESRISRLRKRKRVLESVRRKIKKSGTRKVRKTRNNRIGIFENQEMIKRRIEIKRKPKLIKESEEYEEKKDTIYDMFVDELSEKLNELVDKVQDTLQGKVEEVLVGDGQGEEVKEQPQEELPEEEPMEEEKPIESEGEEEEIREPEMEEQSEEEEEEQVEESFTFMNEQFYKLFDIPSTDKIKKGVDHKKGKPNDVNYVIPEEGEEDIEQKMEKLL